MEGVGQRFISECKKNHKSYASSQEDIANDRIE